MWRIVTAVALLLLLGSAHVAAQPDQVKAQQQLQQLQQPQQLQEPPAQRPMAHHKRLIPLNQHDSLAMVAIFIAIFISSGAGMSGGANDTA
jgi:hypothetical protein